MTAYPPTCERDTVTRMVSVESAENGDAVAKSIMVHISTENAHLFCTTSPFTATTALFLPYRHYCEHRNNADCQ
jgi:hypothetical protein